MVGGVYEKIIDYVAVDYKLYLCLVIATGIRVVIVCRKEIREICFQGKKTKPADKLEAILLLFLSKRVCRGQDSLVPRPHDACGQGMRLGTR